MARKSTWLVVGGLAAGGAVVRHLRGGAHEADGGVLMGDAAAYDRVAGRMLASFYRGVAEETASTATPGTTVLEVGCGPGHLALLLASHTLDVTATDLDPAMIERARLRAGKLAAGSPAPVFEVADASSLPFEDSSFELVVSTLSMHHWESPEAAIVELHRVLRPGGRALIWDLGPGFRPLHGHAPDPVERFRGSPFELMGADPWRWPWRFHLTHRLELRRSTAPTEES